MPSRYRTLNIYPARCRASDKAPHPGATDALLRSMTGRRRDRFLLRRLCCALRVPFFLGKPGEGGLESVTSAEVGQSRRAAPLNSFYNRMNFCCCWQSRSATYPEIYPDFVRLQKKLIPDWNQKKIANAQSEHGIEPASKTISQKPLISPPNLDLASDGTTEHTPEPDNPAILGTSLALQRHCAKIVLKNI